MATIYFLLGIFCLGTAYSGKLCRSDILKNTTLAKYQAANVAKTSQSFYTAVPRNTKVGHQTTDRSLTRRRAHLVDIAKAELGVRELTGHNDGLRVSIYLNTVKLKVGQPWCAAFISWVFQQAGEAYPRSGWSPDLFIPKVRSKEPLPGNLMGIWFANLNRIAHVGLVEKRESDWVLSIEGNTNIAGSRAGDGVYCRRRSMRTIYAYADWLQQKGDAQ